MGKGNFKFGFLLILLIHLLVITSCSNTYEALMPVDLPPTIKQPVYPFDFSSSNPVIYDLAIKTKKQYFSGLFILKKEGPEHFRLAMTSKMGNKLFDMTFQKGQFTVHHMIEPMNRKVVINMMQTLFTFLLEEKKVPETARLYSDGNETFAYRWKSNGDWLTIYQQVNGEVMAYHEGNKRSPDVTIDFKGKENGHPTQIVLENTKWVRFEMLFSQLDRN